MGLLRDLLFGQQQRERKGGLISTAIFYYLDQRNNAAFNKLSSEMSFIVLEIQNYAKQIDLLDKKIKDNLRMFCVQIDALEREDSSILVLTNISPLRENLEFVRTKAQLIEQKARQVEQNCIQAVNQKDIFYLHRVHFVDAHVQKIREIFQMTKLALAEVQLIESEINLKFVNLSVIFRTVNPSFSLSLPEIPLTIAQQNLTETPSAVTLQHRMVAIQEDMIKFDEGQQEESSVQNNISTSTVLRNYGYGQSYEYLPTEEDQGLVAVELQDISNLRLRIKKS